MRAKPRLDRLLIGDQLLPNGRVKICQYWMLPSACLIVFDETSMGHFMVLVCRYFLLLDRVSGHVSLVRIQVISEWDQPVFLSSETVNALS